MDLIRSVVVFDAADVAAESAFWAGMLDAVVIPDDEEFHCVVDASGTWHIGVQHAPGHVPPQWPDGAPQQVHLDLHAQDAEAAHSQALALGARLLRDGDAQAAQGHRVYADPAGHPFCIGWGHPPASAIASLVARRTAGEPAD